MHFKLTLRIIGSALCFEAALMLLPLAVSLISQDGNTACFYVAVPLCAGVGFPLTRLKSKQNAIRVREGFAAVALTWAALSVLGAVPLYLSGHFGSFLDSLFESVSGFTTTGATVLRDVEALPMGVSFWRSFTQWIGGVGVLMFTLALTNASGASALNLLKAETPGLSYNKVLPKIRDAAKTTCLIYIGISAALFAALTLAGMPVFDALIHMFGAAGTGGFSNKNSGIAFYDSAAVEMTLAAFMLVFGVNFTLFIYLVKRNFKAFFKDEELRLYLVFILASFALVTLGTMGGRPFSQTLREAFFRVSSAVSTTAYASAPFHHWQALPKLALVALMIVGACSGSTGCGIKMVRVLMFFKAARNEISRVLHPRAVNVVRVNGRGVETDAVTKALLFVFMYVAVIFAGSLIIAIDRKDLGSAVSAAVAAVGNIGQHGLGLLDLPADYAAFSPLSKISLCLCMLAGRLEILPVAALFTRGMWGKE